MTRRSEISAFPAKTKRKRFAALLSGDGLIRPGRRSPTRIRRRLPMTTYADFRFASTGDLAYLGGPASRFNHNMTAIKLLKSLEADGRAHGDLAPDEQRTFAHYSG